MAQRRWVEAFDRDAVGLGDFLAWIAEVKSATTQRLYQRKVSLDEAIGAQKVLDDLVRCATMHGREQHATAAYTQGVEDA